MLEELLVDALAVLSVFEGVEVREDELVQLWQAGYVGEVFIDGAGGVALRTGGCFLGRHKSFSFSIDY